MESVVAGIIAEFNPFHNGHARLIEEVRKKGATHVVAVMSGNFVQRGGPAGMPKFIRAEAAVAAGVDLIIELPLAWAMSTARRFAHGGVYLLNSLGCVNWLAFGSECGDLSALRRAADVLHTPECSSETKRRLTEGITYALARQRALAALAGPEVASLLESPNNTLAIEYLTAMVHLGISNMEPVTVKREGAPHDSDVAETTTVSAALLRRRLESEGVESLAPYVPEQAFQAYLEGESGGCLPVWERRYHTAVLSGLRMLDREDFSRLPDVSEGLDDRLYNAVRRSTTFPELLEAVKTKRYPLARIRRLVWNAYLGVPAKASQGTPPYLRLLSMNRKGKELLSIANPTLPMSASLRDLERLGGDCAKAARLESRAGDLYALFQPKPRPCGGDYTHRVKEILK